MATLSALHHVGESLVFYLKNSYAKSGPKALVAAEFVQFGTGNLPDKTPPSATVGITLYRVGWNEHLRQAPQGGARKRGMLSLDLNYLITAWGKTAQEEQIPFSWTLLQLHQRPVLDGSRLRGDAGWTAADRIELVPQDLSQEDMARIWDRLASPYRLSAAYTARVLQMEPLETYEEFLPAVARRLVYRGPLEAAEK